MLRIFQNRLVSTCRTQCTRLLSTSTPTDTVSDNDDDRPRERSINRVQLLGRVGRDPELRGSSEHPCFVFPLATNFSFRKASTGERIHRTDWHRIIVFRPHLRDFVVPRIDKGDRLFVEGQLNYVRYTDSEDKTNTVTSVNADDLIILRKKGDRETSWRGEEGEEENL